ncbi:MAG TPA: acetyl-CoA decarbonylase/synthase complex subunit gamma [Planctomycetes bacterium]|nr:acetyl-CoA decarbonylase/synthase complex subunit gamma [Planctomycetota bacterium]
MALSGLEIFKLLPKTNCKECGKPTCLAFAMQLAQKKAKLEDCPHVSEDAKEKLAAAAAPPMQLVKFGNGDNEVQVGRETVLFRHEEKFYNPTVLTVTVSDKLSGEELNKRIEKINSLEFERVGQQIKVNAIAVVNESGSSEKFAAAAQSVKQGSELAMILCSDSPEAIEAAVSKTSDRVPLIASAKEDTAEQMAKISKDNKCPLVVKAPSIEALSQLSEKVKSGGVENLVLTLEDKSPRESLYNSTRMRVLSLRKVFRPLGYPTISFIQGDESEQVAAAASLICKYSNIVVVDAAEPEVILPLLTVVMNIFTDPQKPVQVEPKLYSVGEPDENSPLMFTTNFSLTYYTVESDVESSRVASYILVVDTEGTSVLTAYSGDKLNEKVVADAIKKSNVEEHIKHRKLIIPGYVAVMSGKLEETTGWEVMVGPRESATIPKYLKEVWQ